MSPNISLQKTLKYITHTNNRHALFKTISFAVLHFCVAFSVAYILTGSVLIGGLIAMIEPTINTIVFFFHEKAWKKFEQQQALKEIAEYSES